MVDQGFYLSNVHLLSLCFPSDHFQISQSYLFPSLLVHFYVSLSSLYFPDIIFPQCTPALSCFMFFQYLFPNMNNEYYLFPVYTCTRMFPVLLCLYVCPILSFPQCTLALSSFSCFPFSPLTHFYSLPSIRG